MTGGQAKKSNKTNKNSKRLQLLRRIREIRINYFTLKKNEMCSKRNFQNNEISNNDISLRTGNLLSRLISKTKATNQLDFLLIEKCTFGINSNCVKRLRLNWMISEEK